MSRLLKSQETQQNESEEGEKLPKIHLKKKKKERKKRQTQLIKTKQSFKCKDRIEKATAMIFILYYIDLRVDSSILACVEYPKRSDKDAK